MASAPRLTLIWLTGLVIAIIVHAVSGGYVDKNGKPAAKPCIQGEEYFNSLFVYECKQRKFVLTGCKMNNNQYKLNEIRDSNNLRMQFCVKTGKSIRSGVIGCVTDDGLFLNSTATVTQKNGVQFTCIQEKNTFRVKKQQIAAAKIVTISKKQCKLNDEKLLGGRYLVKCQKTSTGTLKFELHQCLAELDNRTTAFPANESYHHYMDNEKTWGFVFKCETNDNKFSFRPIACLLKNVEIAEGQTQKDGRRSVMCYRDANNKLKLKSAFESEVKTRKCKKTKTYNRGNLRFKCVSGKLPEAISCVSNNGTHFIAIGETYKTVGAFKYVCEKASNGLVFKKVACLDDKGREINENKVYNASDGSQIRCVRNNSTGDLDRIFTSGQNIPCKPGSKPIVINNLQYVCNSRTHYYNPEACVSFDKNPQIIPLGKIYNAKWYRYLCERRNNEIVFHAVNCFDDARNDIAPGKENKSGKKLYKCIVKNEYDLSLVIAETGGCTNPVDQKRLRAGSVMRKSRFVGEIKYKIAFKCVKFQSGYKWEAMGILVEDQTYAVNVTTLEIKGQRYKIVQTGGNDIRMVVAQEYETNCYVKKHTYKHNETWISENGESVFQCVKGHAVKINCRLQKEKLYVLQLEQVAYIRKVPYYCSDDELVELAFDGCIFKKKEHKLNVEFHVKKTVFKCFLEQQNGMYVSSVQAVGCLHNGEKLAINGYVLESDKYQVCKEIEGLAEMRIATAEESACISKTNTIDCSGAGLQVDGNESQGASGAVDSLNLGDDAADYHFNNTDELITDDENDDDDIYVTLYPPNGSHTQIGCVNGTKVNNGQVIHVCYQNKMVYYGCFVNGREHRESEIVDRKNLRSRFCVKKGNRIISSVIGCLTDDGIFLEGNQNVTQSDGVVFTCQPRYTNGVRNGYTFTKLTPPKLTSTCHLGEQKVLRNIYVLECRNSETTIGGFEYTLKGCLTTAGDLSSLIKPNQTHDEFFDESDFGFRYACVIRKRQLDVPVIYTYEAIACLSGKQTIAPGQIYNSGSLTVMCYQEGRFLRLKPVYVGLSTEICTDNSIFYLGNFKYECRKGKQKRAVACLSFKNNTEVKIGEYFDEPFTYRYQCQLYTYKNSLSFTKTHCLDDKNQPMDPGTRKVLNDDSAILCRYDQNTDELARISISGRLHKCKLGDDSVFVKNYIAYKCVKHTGQGKASEGQYKPVGCAPENDKSAFIQFGEFHSSQFYRYICEKKGEFSAVYRAVVCLDGFGLEIKPQHRERTGDFVYKCVRKAAGSLEMKIYNPRGCLNPFKNHTLLKPGSFVKETGNIHGISYEKRFKCVRAGIYFELIAEGIFFKGSRYERPGQVVFEKNGGKLIIVQTHSGGYDIEFKRNDQLRCYYNQKVYENGAHFIAPSGNSIYHCNNGEMTKISCKIGKYQLHVGQTTAIDKQIYQCPYISEGYIKIPISGCHLKNGTDIPFGMSFIDKSVVYRCSYQGGGSDYKAVIIAVGCIMNDHVIPINGYREIIRGRKQFFICRLGYEEGPSVIESNEMETDCITARGKVDCNDVNEYGYYSLSKTMFGSSSGSYVIQDGGEEVGCVEEWDVIQSTGEPNFGHLTYSSDGGTGTDVYFTIPSDTSGVSEIGTTKLVTVPSISTNGFTITNLTATSYDGTTNSEPESTDEFTSSSTFETDVTDDEFTSSTAFSSGSTSSIGLTSGTSFTIQPSGSTRPHSSNSGGSSVSSQTVTGVTGGTHISGATESSRSTPKARTGFSKVTPSSESSTSSSSSSNLTPGTGPSIESLSSTKSQSSSTGGSSFTTQTVTGVTGETHNSEGTQSSGSTLETHTEFSKVTSSSAFSSSSSSSSSSTSETEVTKITSGDMTEFTGSTTVGTGTTGSFTNHPTTVRSKTSVTPALTSKDTSYRTSISSGATGTNPDGSTDTVTISTGETHSSETMTSVSSSSDVTESVTSQSGTFGSTSSSATSKGPTSNSRGTKTTKDSSTSGSVTPGVSHGSKFTTSDGTRPSRVTQIMPSTSGSVNSKASHGSTFTTSKSTRPSRDTETTIDVSYSGSVTPAVSHGSKLTTIDGTRPSRVTQITPDLSTSESETPGVNSGSTFTTSDGTRPSRNTETTPDLSSSGSVTPGVSHGSTLTTSEGTGPSRGSETTINVSHSGSITPSVSSGRTVTTSGGSRASRTTEITIDLSSSGSKTPGGSSGSTITTSDGTRPSRGTGTTDDLSTSGSVTPGVNSGRTVTTSGGTRPSRVTQITLDSSTSESETSKVSSESTFTTSGGTRPSKGTGTTVSSAGYGSSRVPVTDDTSDSTAISIGLSSTGSKGTPISPDQTGSTGASSGSTSSIKISTDVVVTTGTSETAETSESRSTSSSSNSFSTSSSSLSSFTTEEVSQSTSEQNTDLTGVTKLPFTGSSIVTSKSTGSTSVGTTGIPNSRATRISTETTEDSGSSLPRVDITVTGNTDDSSTASRGTDSSSSHPAGSSSTGYSTGITHGTGSTLETETHTQETSNTGKPTDITHGTGSTLVDTAQTSNSKGSTIVFTDTNEQSSSTSSFETHRSESTEEWSSTGTATGVTASLKTDSTLNTVTGTGLTDSVTTDDPKDLTHGDELTYPTNPAGTGSSIKTSSSTKSQSSRTGGSSFTTQTVTGVTGVTHKPKNTGSSRSTSVTGVTDNTHDPESTGSLRSTSETSTGFSKVTSSSAFSSSSSSSSSYTSETEVTKVTDEGTTDESGSTTVGTGTPDKFTVEPTTVCNETAVTPIATDGTEYPSSGTPSLSSKSTGYSKTVTSTGSDIPLSTVDPEVTFTPKSTNYHVTGASTSSESTSETKLHTGTAPSSSSGSPGATHSGKATRHGTTVQPGSTSQFTDVTGVTGVTSEFSTSTSSESSWSTESASSFSSSTREERSSLETEPSFGSTGETGKTRTTGITKTPATGFSTSRVSSSGPSGGTSGTEIYTTGTGETIISKTSSGSSSASKLTTIKTERSSVSPDSTYETPSETGGTTIRSSDASKSPNTKTDRSSVFPDSSYGTTSEAGKTTIGSSDASESPNTKAESSSVFTEPSHKTRTATGTNGVTKVPSTRVFISRSSSFEISDGTSQTKINSKSTDKTLAGSSTSPEFSRSTERASSTSTNTRAERSSMSTGSYSSTSETNSRTTTSDGITKTLPTEFFSSSSSSFGSSGGTKTTKKYTIGTDQTAGSSVSSNGTPNSDYSVSTSRGRTHSPKVTHSRGTGSTTVNEFRSSTTKEASSSTFVTGRSSSSVGSSHSTRDGSFGTDTSGTRTTSTGDDTTIIGITPSGSSNTVSATFVTSTTNNQTKPSTTSHSTSSTSETPTTVTEEYVSSLSTIQGVGIVTEYPLRVNESKCVDLIAEQVCLKFLPICAPHALKRNIAHSAKQDRVQLIDYDLDRVDKLQTSQQFKKFIKEMEQHGVINSLNSLHFQKHADLILAQPKKAVGSQQCDELRDSCRHNNQESCLAHDDYCFKGDSGVCRTEATCQKSVNNHRRETAEFLTRLCPVTCGLQTCFVEGSKAYDIDEIDGFVDALRTCQ